MRTSLLILVANVALLVFAAPGFAQSSSPAARPERSSAGGLPDGQDLRPAAGGTGTIRGRVRLTGELPGNPVIRMGADPMCAKLNAGKRAIQEVVAADAKGNLANVFVRLEGSFPKTAVPSRPVIIAQRGCVYAPRVIGMRVGQTLEFRNDDPLAHNVHGISKGANGFTANMPHADMTYSFKPKAEEVMLRIGCDFHRWMTTYVGVVSNPYFAVTGEKGAFEIAHVPPGSYTVQAWQEMYGVVTRTVKVTAGATTDIDFLYSADKKPHSPGRL